MSYKPHEYRSKSVYFPRGLCDQAERRAAALYMNFTVYVRKLVVEDLQKAKVEDPSIVKRGSQPPSGLESIYDE